jgi:hypothetical protein
MPVNALLLHKYGINNVNRVLPSLINCQFVAELQITWKCRFSEIKKPSPPTLKKKQHP